MRVERTPAPQNLYACMYVCMYIRIYVCISAPQNHQERFRGISAPFVLRERGKEREREREEGGEGGGRGRERKRKMCV